VVKHMLHEVKILLHSSNSPILQRMVDCTAAQPVRQGLRHVWTTGKNSVVC
jgi:hypothetical protein